MEYAFIRSLLPSSVSSTTYRKVADTCGDEANWGDANMFSNTLRTASLVYTLCAIMKSLYFGTLTKQHVKLPRALLAHPPRYRNARRVT